LYLGVIYAFLQSSGTVLESIKNVKIDLRIGAIGSTVSFKTLELIESGPLALWMSRFCNSFKIPGVVMLISGIVG